VWCSSHAVIQLLRSSHRMANRSFLTTQDTPTSLSHEVEKSRQRYHCSIRSIFMAKLCDVVDLGKSKVRKHGRADSRRLDCGHPSSRPCGYTTLPDIRRQRVEGAGGGMLESTRELVGLLSSYIILRVRLVRWIGGPHFLGGVRK